MTQGLNTARKGQDIEVGALSATSLTLAGASVDTAVLLASGQVVDLNGEADALIFDAAQNVRMDGSTAGHLKVKISGAYDFDITANTFTSLSGSTIATNTIAETTAASGVTIDSVLLKDGGVIQAASTALGTDIISEVTSANGVVIDGLTIKDGVVGVKQAITGDGAITIQNAYVVLSKGSAGAITLAAPTSGTHDGLVIEVIAISAQAHVITGSVDGFNAKGSSGTATFGGAIGYSVRFRANGGHWYVVSKVNVTIA
jgi:hypothetical protein